MTAARHLSWDNFRATVFIPGQQRVHRVSESPHIEVFGDGANGRIGLWLDVPAGIELPAELSTFAFIAVGTVSRHGQPVLEVSTSTASLFRQFYHFAVAVAERILVEDSPPIEAVGLELQCFGDLLKEKAALGLERQLGLIGELLFLERLIKRDGPVAVDAWLGPMGEPHDFRVRTVEYEVKTTVSPHRTHTIHGMEQLVPSQGCTLFLASVVLGPPGAGEGFSLGSKVADLQTLLTPTPQRRTQFQHALEASGFTDADTVHYKRSFVMRRPIGLVRVDESCPALTRPMIDAALGPLAPRVDSLHYDVNVSGLEAEDGTSRFDAWMSE